MGSRTRRTRAFAVEQAPCCAEENGARFLDDERAMWPPDRRTSQVLQQRVLVLSEVLQRQFMHIRSKFQRFQHNETGTLRSDLARVVCGTCLTRGSTVGCICNCREIGSGKHSCCMTPAATRSREEVTSYKHISSPTCFSSSMHLSNDGPMLHAPRSKG
jgi:hypothetical protein